MVWCKSQKFEVSPLEFSIFLHLCHQCNNSLALLVWQVSMLDMGTVRIVLTESTLNFGSQTHIFITCQVLIISICPPDMLLKSVSSVVCNRFDFYLFNLCGAKTYLLLVKYVETWFTKKVSK